MDDLSARLLQLAQEGLPIDERPYLRLAEELGVGEQDVIEILASLQQQGIIRELSAFLDPRQLGYESTLACMAVPPERVDEVSALFKKMPEITHSYLRDHEYNLWFTLISPKTIPVGNLVERVEQLTGLGPVRSLPASKVHKIRVAFKADEMST